MQESYNSYNQQKIRKIKLMEEQKEKLERIYQKLNEEEDTVLKKWYESIIPKIILLFPSIAFALTFLKVNTDKSILDLIIFIAVGGLLVTGGIFLNYFLSKGK
nr:conserved hypothetical protein [uncultured Prochlorococcus marinus clone ASNC2259]